MPLPLIPVPKITVAQMIKTPGISLAIVFLVLLGFFVTLYTGSNSDCDAKLAAKDMYIQRILHDKDSIAGRFFDVMVDKDNTNRENRELRRIISNTDSVVRTKTEVSAKAFVNHKSR